jgi:hypothetical protein
MADAGRVETCVRGRLLVFDAAHREALREFLWRVDHPERRRRVPYADPDDPGGGGGGGGVAEPVGPPADARPRPVGV